MRYDMHVHLNIHSDEGEMEKYEYFAKMNNMDVVGFVIHYNPKMSKRELRDYRDFVESLNIKSLAGIELYYPFSKMPRGFDFYIVHFSNMSVDADILSHLREVIIAHPFAYGMNLDESSIPVMVRNNIAVECNSAHFFESLIPFYRRIREEGIRIPFGSDAHSPEEIGAGFDELKHIFTPFEDLNMFL
jgi:histidinol phosphatase-like PHP family hydrolase